MKKPGRAIFTATLLSSGRVLVAGGSGIVPAGDLTLFNSAELFDPDSGSWTATGGLNTGRFLYTATLLADGRVLAAGGGSAGFSALASAEVYDPG